MQDIDVWSVKKNMATVEKNKLNIGCGLDIKEDYLNADIIQVDGVGLIIDINKFPYKIYDNEYDEILCKNILEYAFDLPKVMEELYRIAKDRCIIKINVPAFPSPYSIQNPMIKSFFSYNTFDYYIKDDGLDNSYLKPTFKILEKRFIFSDNKYLYWISQIVNIFPRFYSRFLFMIFPSNRIEFLLEVKK
jgi:hypothetical protein